MKRIGILVLVYVVGGISGVGVSLNDHGCSGSGTNCYT